MEFGNSGIHGTLTDYPFLIVENKDTGNVARICIYYAYSQNTGTELNAEAINLNYLLINSALKNIGQQELANVISTIKNKVSSANNDDVPVKGIEYGTMNGSKNSYGNLKGFYLMFGTTMDSLYEKKEDVEQQEGNEEINDDKTSTNKQENSNNSNSEDKQTSNSNNQNANNSSNSNSDNDEEYQDTSVMLTHKQLENKTEQELKTLLTSKGLVPKVVSKTEEIAYSDDLANTTKSTVKLQLGNEGKNFYNKGDTVEITNTYYKPTSWTAELCFSATDCTFDVNGKTCRATGTGAGTYCFFKDPLEIDGYFVYDTKDYKGVEFYIDNKCLEKGTYTYHEYTFDSVETITLKLVAPYIYEFDEGILNGEEGTIIGTNVVVYEKKLNVKDLYKSMRGNNVDLEIK